MKAKGNDGNTTLSVDTASSKLLKILPAVTLKLSLKET